MDDCAPGASRDEVIVQRIAQLELVVSHLEEQLAAATEAEAIMRRAALPPVPRHAAPRRPPRDRHGLHIVPGAAAAALAWALRSRAHKVVASAAGLALATGTALTPAVMGGPPASASPSPPARAQPHTPRSGTVAVPLVISSPAVRKRRRRRDRPSPDAAPSTPAPDPSPDPSPSPALVSPTPRPTLPLPTPSLPLPSPAGSELARVLTG